MEWASAASPGQTQVVQVITTPHAPITGRTWVRRDAYGIACGITGTTWVYAPPHPLTETQWSGAHVDLSGTVGQSSVMLASQVSAADWPVQMRKYVPGFSRVLPSESSVLALFTYFGTLSTRSPVSAS